MIFCISCTKLGLDGPDHSSHSEASQRVGPLHTYFEMARLGIASKLVPPALCTLTSEAIVHQWAPLFRVHSGGAGQEEISPACI